MYQVITSTASINTIFAKTSTVDQLGYLIRGGKAIRRDYTVIHITRG